MKIDEQVSNDNYIKPSAKVFSVSLNSVILQNSVEPGGSEGTNDGPEIG